MGVCVGCLWMAMALQVRAQDGGVPDSGAPPLTGSPIYNAPPPSTHGPNHPEDGFTFSSYGRVMIASNLQGRMGRNGDLTTYSSRLDESTYTELALTYRKHVRDLDTRVVSRLAIAGPLFHDSGDFDAHIAVRDLYVEVDHAMVEGLALWAGSRMVRGDDVYLIDTWPLDNLNMVGGGARYAYRDLGELLVHVGLTAPDQPYYQQTIETPARFGVLPTSVITLDRPRLILAEKLVVWPFGRARDLGLKLVLYAEEHSLPAGERRRDDGSFEPLSHEDGWLLGGQLGGWFAPMHAFVNLFARYARGIASYNPLDAPFRNGGGITPTAAASEFFAALSANWEYEWFGVMAGGFYRLFRDPLTDRLGGGEIAEGTVIVRPMAWLFENIGLAVEGSWQSVTTSILTDDGQRVHGSAWKFGVIPFFSPFGRGTYTRPHLRIIYSVTLRDQASTLLYPMGDFGANHTTEHFLGIGAEWWFDAH